MKQVIKSRNAPKVCAEHPITVLLHVSVCIRKFSRSKYKHPTVSLSMLQTNQSPMKTMQQLAAKHASIPQNTTPPLTPQLALQHAQSLHHQTLRHGMPM